MPRWYAGRSVARPSYYDRDAETLAINYNNANAPHGQTTRATYTAPVGYGAFVEVVNMGVLRQVAAGAVSYYGPSLFLNPSSGGSFLISQIITNDNAVGAFRSSIITTYGYVKAGDVIAFTTIDSSTGGSVSYLQAMKATEFLV